MTLGSPADVLDAALLDELRVTWERTLGPFVSELPEVEVVPAETRERLDALLVS